MLKSLVLVVCVALSNGRVLDRYFNGNKIIGSPYLDPPFGSINGNAAGTNAYWWTTGKTGGFEAPVRTRYSSASGFGGHTLFGSMDSINPLCQLFPVNAAAGNILDSLQQIYRVIGEPRASFVERFIVGCELSTLWAMVQQNVNGRSGLFNGNGLINIKGEMVVLKCGMHSCTFDCD